MTDQSVIKSIEIMTPKIVDKERRKKDIALVALDIFAEKGFEAASVSQIAEAAGIGKGTIYEYFESKEELFYAALLAWVERMQDRAEELLVGIDDPVDRLKRFVRDSMDLFISDERTIKIILAMFQSLFGSSELLHHDLIRETFRGFRKTITDNLLEAVSRGLLRPEIAKDAEKIAINLAAYLDGIALHYYMSKDYFDLREQVAAYLEELIESLGPQAAD